jgi:hypothetical protein
MGTRSVRLDDESEQILRAVMREEKVSVSEALKRGLLALKAQSAHKRPRSAYAIYSELDLGPGGYAIAPARDSREAVRRAIRKKLGR